MRVLVTGGRDFADVIGLWRALDKINAEFFDREGIRCVIEGASDDVTGPYVGADYWAHQWALARTIPTFRSHADWKKHGRAAGPIRNARMIQDGRPDLCVRFPGGRGTADCVRQARAAGIEVREIAP